MIFWKRDRLSTPVILGFPGSSAGKESACNVGDLGLIPGLGISPEKGKSYPFQYSGLEYYIDCMVHGVAKSRTQLRNFYFIFLGSNVAIDGDFSHEIKRCLLLGRKVMTNLDSIFKSRDFTLPTKVRVVKAMVFLVVMYECESWTINKAERRRIDAFELCC